MSTVTLTNSIQLKRASSTETRLELMAFGIEYCFEIIFIGRCLCDLLQLGSVIVSTIFDLVAFLSHHLVALR